MYGHKWLKKHLRTVKHDQYHEILTLKRLAPVVPPHVTTTSPTGRGRGRGRGHASPHTPRGQRPTERMPESPMVPEATEMDAFPEAKSQQAAAASVGATVGAQLVSTDETYKSPR